MPISGFNLTGFSTDTDATSYATGSITPTANRLVLAWVLNDILGGTPNTPTLSGCSLTWVLEHGFVFALDGTIRVGLYRALGASPSAGAVTVDCAGQSQDLCIVLISEFSGVNTGGTNGSGAVRGAAHDEGNSSSALVTLGAFASPNNGTAAGVFGGGTATVSPGSGFTELNEASTSVTTRVGESEWRADNDTTPDMTWAGGMAWGIVAVELIAATSTTNKRRLFSSGNTRQGNRGALIFNL